MDAQLLLDMAKARANALSFLTAEIKENETVSITGFELFALVEAIREPLEQGIDQLKQEDKS
ncbi:hypothetical protein FLL45_01645 [Aliikangiella marina]|uniref:Uncharacterized protein n=1 Tax=Aliikangiella marina TaxID=1712262 RepID=A0A545THQ9_9GAMM|nr:hypothetical protein [Aliikangiella marina]TQV76691.1 hypothetical protein FLL45_01645 [Aliikangiella marina]